VQKILFACWDFSIGGHSSYTLNFARALRRRGYIVGALVLEPFGELYGEFKEGLDDVVVVRRGLETRANYLRRLLRCITDWKPDVLINSAVPMVQALLPTLPAEVLRISVVHSIIESQIALANGASLDWVVAVSDSLREKVERESPGGVRVTTIPAGLGMPCSQRRLEAPAKPLRLIYVGRMWPEKNLTGLLRVLSALHSASVPFSMTVVGAGKELESICAQAVKSTYANQINFLGARTPKEVSQLLDQHDFLLMTSHYEGTPHAALEAMAHGLVVLVSRIPGATDRIITHGVDGFLCDKDVPEDYVAILRRVSSSPAEFAGVSGAARRTVSSRYSADAIAAQYESLFKERTVRTKRAVKDLNGSIQIPPNLLLNFPGTVFQAKHRVVDIWRRVAHGRRPVSSE
jgi:glycosyltransferase involved in cell wall biosynthesis